jgi:hypothetical protein
VLPTLPALRFQPRLTGPGARPRAQTSFVGKSLCAECRRLINSGRPADHAPGCSHHPSQFTPEFDWSTWLTTPSDKRTLSPIFAQLMQRYTTALKRCSLCGKLVTGPMGDTHAPNCPFYRAPSSPPAPSRPLPKFDDIRWVKLGSPAGSKPTPGISATPPHRLSQPGPRSCPLCGRIITVSGTTEWGHKLTCPNSMLRKLLREL